MPPTVRQSFHAMPFREETITMRNPHLWTLSSPMTVEEFAAQYPPTKTFTKDGGRDGYIWVINETVDEDTNWAKLAGAPNGEAAEDVKKASRIWNEALWRAQEIRNDAKIPEWMQVGGGGPPSKTMMLDRLVIDTEDELYKIAQAGRWGSGKWLFFVPMDRLDHIWAVLTASIIHGPLSRLEMARCQSIKTATVDSSRHTSTTHTVISLYFEDCFNRKHAEEVLRCCSTAHNLIPRSVKPDLWTLVGIDVNNDLRFRPTIFKANDFMPWASSKGPGRNKPRNSNFPPPRQRTSSQSSKKSSRSHNSDQREEPQQHHHHRHHREVEDDHFFDATDGAAVVKVEDAAPEQAVNGSPDDMPGEYPGKGTDGVQASGRSSPGAAKVFNCVLM